MQTLVYEDEAMQFAGQLFVPADSGAVAGGVVLLLLQENRRPPP